MSPTFVLWVHPTAHEAETQSGLFEAENEFGALSFSTVLDCARGHVC